MRLPETMSQSGTAEKCSTDCKVERCDKEQIVEDMPGVILLYMKSGLLYPKISNDTAFIQYAIVL